MRRFLLYVSLIISAAGCIFPARAPLYGQASAAVKPIVSIPPATMSSSRSTSAPAAALTEYSFTPESTGSLRKEGRWLRDAQGRYVLLRGVNFGSRNKLSPYIPIMPLASRRLDHDQFEAELSAVQPQISLLRAMGMNVVRLPILWMALEPTPNPDLDQLMPEAKNYLQYVKEIIARLHAEGIYVIVDFHQDIVSDNYGGDGFPDWALQTDKKHSHLPASSVLTDRLWSTNYFHAPWYLRVICHCSMNSQQVRSSMRAFWEDQLDGAETSNQKDPANLKDDPLLVLKPQTHLVKTIGQTVKFLSSSEGGEINPAIIGYEPFNEPTEAGLNKREFEQKILPGYYHRVEAEIGKYDSNSLVFIEPRMDWTVYEANGSEFKGLTFTNKPKTFLPAPYTPASSNGGVFSFHYYDLTSFTGMIESLDMHRMAKQWPGIFHRMSEAADKSGMVPFLTEFGCSQDWTKYTNLRPKIYHNQVVRACMDLLYQQVEANLLNATYWNYDLYNQEQSKDNWNGENFSLLGPGRMQRNTDIVARPYPMRSSAEPQRVFFDLESKNAAIVLAGAVTDAPTVIYVPRSLNYAGDDFEVRATTPPSSVVWDEKNQLLYWHPDGTLHENQIIISLVGGFDEKVLPADSRSLIPATRFVMVVGKNKPTPVEITPAKTLP